MTLKAYRISWTEVSEGFGGGHAGFSLHRDLTAASNYLALVYNQSPHDSYKSHEVPGTKCEWEYREAVTPVTIEEGSLSAQALAQQETVRVYYPGLEETGTLAAEIRDLPPIGMGVLVEYEQVTRDCIQNKIRRAPAWLTADA